MPENKLEKAREKAFEDIKKQHGVGSIMTLGQSDAVEKVEVISTGTSAIDDLTGIGGFPRGKIVEIYGPECLDSESFIQYSVVNSKGRSNHKGGTIQRLYERFHNLSASGDGRGKYQRKATIAARYFAPSINEKGRIISNEILDVVYVGEKPGFRVQTVKGYIIDVSENHGFLTDAGYQELKNISVGSTVFIHNSTPFKTGKPANSNASRIDLYVKHHPVAGTKSILDYKSGKRYEYHRLARARAVVEASQNGLALDTYIARLNEGKLDGLIFLNKNEHVHHKNEIVWDDDLENLKILLSPEHSRLHATERHNNLRFTIVPDEICSITAIGLRPMFDLKMKSPYHNFVANHFAVHNSSGKSTLALQVVAQAQKTGHRAAYIDIENAVDPIYSAALGVDIEHLDFSQPDYGEQALEIALRLIESKVYAVIVVDSVAALVPLAEIEGSMGDPQMGLQARLMSQAMRKLNSAVANSGTCLIFINQTRQKIGVVFGNPETTAGGVALKFYSSLRISVHKSTVEKNSSGAFGQEVKIKMEKNKMAPPLKETKVLLRFGQGFVNE